MNSEHSPLITQREVPFEISRHSNRIALYDEPRHATSSYLKTVSTESHTLSTRDKRNSNSVGNTILSPQQLKGSTVFQTSLNIAKICMGTGTLALPFAAQTGGLLFNAVGMGVIGVWNYYSANCLLRSFDLIAEATMEQHILRSRNDTSSLCKEQGEQNEIFNNAIDISGNDLPAPPAGTTTYGKIAWYALGKRGLVTLELLMLFLFVGLLVAYEVAMMCFVDGITFGTGSHRFDRLIPSIIVGSLSCAPDLSFLSKFSILGLMALALSFGVICWQGFRTHHWTGFENIGNLNLWPDSLSGASSWFGVVVFGYGIVPVIFNVRDSMAEPSLVSVATGIGLTVTYLCYFFASNGIFILYSHSQSFKGDVLQVLPDTQVASAVRLLMTFVVSVTAPLVVVPCGELIEGKLGMDSTSKPCNRILIRVPLCILCTLLAETVPSFVHVISFVGCFSVAIAGFVLPPLFCIRLRKKEQPGLEFDFVLLALGVATTVVTSMMTFYDIVTYTQISSA